VLREYEFTIITNAQLQEGDQTKLLDKYEKLFIKDGGQMIRKDVWGPKKLAFEINKHYRGFYVWYDFVGKPENLAEAKRLMRIDENVLRYLAVRIGEDVDVNERKAELAKLEAKAAESREMGL
jgi:small subunit ribosomal protein S6